MARFLKFARQHAIWPAFLLIPAVWCALAHFDRLDFLENKFTDWRFSYRGEIDAPVKIVYVDIDSRATDEIGNQPWRRHYFSRVCEALINRAQVKAVGVDYVFSEAGMAESVDRAKMWESNIEFGRYLAKNPPVVLAAFFGGTFFRDMVDKHGALKQRELPILAKGLPPIDQIEPPELPTLRINEKRTWNPPNVGIIDTIDGATRSVPAFTPTSVKTYYHLAFELARLHWGLGQDGLQVHDDRIDFVRPDGTVVASTPLRDKQIVDINWFSPWVSSQRNPRVSFSEVYAYLENLNSDNPTARQSAEKFFAQDGFKDAIVLIGPVDPLLQDIAVTPVDDRQVPRVGLHGNMLKTIVSGIYLRRISDWGGYALVYGLTLLVTLLAVSGGAHSQFAKVMAVLAASGYVGLAFWLFRTSHLLLPMAAPLGAAFSTSFTALIWQVLQEQKQRGRIQGMFGTYVSPQLVDSMVASDRAPQLGGHEDEITAYFSDIQSFSTFSEKLPAAKLVDLMNEYLTACTDIVTAQGGTLDKYIGDAVVAMFGAPVPLKDHAFRACVASQLVHRQLAELRAKWEAEGDKWPEIVWKMQSRIGLNSGRCIIGNMGSRTRFNYTMMGDDVNLAARMESGAKSWGAYTMCTEVTKQRCVEHGGDRVVFRALGRIVVKGRTQAVPIHEIVGLKEHVTDATRECIGRFEQALVKYYARDWDGAIALFEQCTPLEANIPGKTPGVVSNPSLVYLGITEHYKEEPPAENWNGVYVMKEK